MTNKLRRFYIDTALPLANLEAVSQRLAALRVDERYKAVARNGVVAVLSADGALFASLSEAERAQQILQRGAPEVFENTAVALVDIGTGPLASDDAKPRTTPLKSLTEPKLVVCVEDEEMFSTMVENILDGMGIECVVVDSGRKALAVIEDMDPDLVLLDLMMPDMHGWEVMEQMQMNDLTSDIPVIILTAVASEQDRVFAHVVAGVKDYLEKPVLPNQLRESVLKVLCR